MIPQSVRLLFEKKILIGERKRKKKTENDLVLIFLTLANLWQSFGNLSGIRVNHVLIKERVRGA